MERSSPPPAPAGSPSDRGRRKLLNWLLGGSVSALLASVAYPVVRFLAPPRIPEASTRRVEVGPVNDPELVERSFKIVRFGSEPVILLRVGEEYRAFSATCTHLDCIVEYDAGDRLIRCNCHDGRYDLTGRNVGGPPPRPLERFTVHQVDAGDGQPPTLVVERS